MTEEQRARWLALLPAVQQQEPFFILKPETYLSICATITAEAVQAERKIRVIAWREVGTWVAQCLEHDIGAQAPDLATLHYRLAKSVALEYDESLSRTGTPFGGIDPAPGHFWQTWQIRPRDVVTFYLDFRGRGETVNAEGLNPVHSEGSTPSGPTNEYQRGFDAGVAAERSRLSAGVEMTERDAWSVLDKVFFHLNNGDNGGAIEFIRTLIAEASARATAAERERCARWHDHEEAEHRRTAKYLAGVGNDADAADADAIAEEHKISAAAHRTGEGE